VAGLADQMKMPRLPIGVFEAEAPLAEVHLAGDARVDHPLQRAVHGCAADATILTANEIDQIVSAEMPLLAEEDVDNLLPLAGALATRRRQPAEIW
jgi:hypothetical protein